VLAEAHNSVASLAPCNAQGIGQFTSPKKEQLACVGTKALSNRRYSVKAWTDARRK